MADVNANIGVNIDTSAALAQLKALQRQISQFHTSIAKSSETAALAQRDLQKNFLNSVNAIGAFSAELRTVKTTSESFTDSLQKNKFSMREYFRYAGASTKTFGKLFKSEFDTIGKVADDRVKRLQTQYIKLGRDTSGVMKAIAIMPNQLDMSNFSTQTQLAAQKQAIFNQLVKQGSTNLLNFGKNTQWAGRQLMVGFTLPLATLGTVATRTFMEMEQATIKFRKVYGDLFTPTEETTQALDNITALGQMFTQYGIAVSQTVGLAAEAAAAGFSGVDLQRQTTEATRLSILGQVDAQKALETTISLQNAFRMSSDQLASSIDFLNAVENQTVVSLDDITTAIPKVAPVIEQLGGDVKDLAFFMAAMKEGGINASEGANALKSGLAALINPTAKASAMLAGMGINIKKIIEDNQGDLKTTVIEFAQALDTLDPLTRARAIEQLFGKFQFARLSTLFTNVINETGQASRVLDLAGTSIEDLAALSESELGMTADSAMNKFKKSVEDLKFALVPVGQTFMEAVTPIVEFLGGILERFNNLSTGVKKAIVVLTVAIGAIGPIALMTFGLLANGLANIVKGALVLRNGYLRLTGQTQVLGEQTEYLTMEQIDAAAASHSLDQSHAKLTQTFTAESSAVAQLIAAYQQATAAAAKFAAVNPGMMRAPGTPTKRADGKPLVVGGTGNKDSELALLMPGETVIPTKMSKKYAPLINGMIADNIPGYRRGLGAGDAEFAQSIAGVAPQKSQAKIQAFLERELQAIPEALVQEFKSLVITVSQEVNLSEKALKERLRNFRSQYVANIGQQERQQFAHIGSAPRISAGDLRESGAITNAKTQERLDYFIEKVGADTLVDPKTGFGANLTGALNNAMQNAGASLEAVITDSVNIGADKWRKSIEIGGGNFDNLADDVVRFDADFNRNLQSAYDNGARVIVDSQAQIEEMRMQAIAKNEEFDDTIYVALDTIAEQTRQNINEVGAGLNAVFEEALQTITEVRYYGLDPQQTAALGDKFTGRKGANYGRITPGGTDYGRKVGGVGSFRDLPLAQQSVANVDAAIAATAQAAGTASPSKKTIPIGEDIARGLEVGMANQQDEVAMAGQELGAAAVSGTQSGRRAAFRAQGPAGTDEPTQSGGPRVRRRADRPQAPADLTLEQARQSAISPAIKDAIDQEVTARKTSAQRIDSMNKGLMAGTFALTSLAGAGSMASGPLGDLSQHVMKYSGLLFALMSVTQLLTQAKFAELVATRAKTVADVMGSKTVGGLFSRGGGLAGFGKNILTAGKFLLRFAGPIGLATTAMIGTISVIKMVNAARERERVAIEGLADAMTTTTAQVKTLGDFFGVVPTKLPFELGQREFVGKETRTQRETLKADSGFQKEFKSTIESLRKATNDEAKIVFSSLALNLKAQGFASDQVQVIIDALREESSQTDVVLDVKSLTLSKESLDQLKKDIAPILVNLDKALDAGMTKTFVGGRYNVPIQEVITLSKDAQKQLETTAEFISETAKSASGMFELGLIDGKAYEETLGTILAVTNGLDEAQRKLLLSKVFEKLGIQVDKYTDALFTARQEMQLLALLSSGVLSKDSPILKALASTDYKTQMRGVNGLNKLYDQMFSSLEKIAKEEKKVGTVTGKDTDGKKSAFQLAIEQLEKQQEELKNTKIAYDMLKKAGFDAATATKFAGDSVIALGLATGKISTTQIEQVATLMTDIEKRAGSEAIRNFLDSLGTENTLKTDFAEILPTFQKMGATAKDIENVLNNPTLMESFVDGFATAEQRAERMQKYIDAVRTGEAIDVKFDLIINPDKAKEELKKKASELFSFLERAAQREYKPLIIDAEKEVKNAQDAVDKIQKSIDSIQDKIDLEQRNLETVITRKIEQYQEQINDLQRTIEIQFDRPVEAIQNEISSLERGIELDFERPLAVLQETSSDLSNDLTLMDKQAESINEKYDAQAKALQDVANINQKILGQQKQQLSIADALTQGDISAAAQLAQESRSAAAEASSVNAENTLQAARQLELDKLRNAAGLTRKQIEEAQFTISQQIFNIEEQREAIQARIQIKQDQIFALEKARQTTLTQIKGIEDSIYILEEQREAVMLLIRGYEDDIYNIKVKQLEPAAKALEDAQKELQLVKDQLQARLDNIDLQRDAFEAAEDAAIAAKIAQGEYNDVIAETVRLLGEMASMLAAISAASNIKSLNVQTGATGSEVGSSAYVAPEDTEESIAAFEDFITIVENLDAAQEAADAAAAFADSLSGFVDNGGFGGNDANYERKLAARAAAEEAARLLAEAQAAYDATLPVGDANATGGSGGAGAGRFGFQVAAKGGLIAPMKFAMGGFASGTDTVPAMLTPGEFVMSKYAVNSYGVDKMKAINSGSYEGEKVYNYNLSVNVKSDANPDDIARVVMTQIRQIDSQRIRTQRA
jgi:TP901 family phage tail tape measure protein